jgi:hypothetical protein
VPRLKGWLSTREESKWPSESSQRSMSKSSPLQRRYQIGLSQRRSRMSIGKEGCMEQGGKGGSPLAVLSESVEQNDERRPFRDRMTSRLASVGVSARKEEGVFCSFSRRERDSARLDRQGRECLGQRLESMIRRDGWALRSSQTERLGHDSRQDRQWS